MTEHSPKTDRVTLSLLVVVKVPRLGSKYRVIVTFMLWGVNV